LEEEGLFCPNCGYPLKHGKKLSFKFWLILPLVLLILLGRILFYLYLFPKVNPQASLEKQNKVENEIKECLSSGKLPQEEQLNSMIQEMEQAVRLNPDNKEAQEDLASLYLWSGELEKAKGELEELLKSDPENAYAQEMLKPILNFLGYRRRRLSLSVGAQITPEFWGAIPPRQVRMETTTSKKLV